MKRSGSIYSGMRSRRRRIEEKPKVDLPFSIAHLRIMLEGALEGVCSYCHGELTVKNMSADHRIPVERGGSWQDKNVRIICGSCNGAKGRMNEDEFIQLMDVLNGFDQTVRREVLGRLKAGASVVRLQFLKR
jgi:5-methylcytosine-specific restriction endonuclease McrA